jgi:hypothetical protein
MEKIRIRDGKIGSGIKHSGSAKFGRTALRSPERDVLLTEDLVTHVGDVVKHCLVLHHEVLLKY